MGDSRCKLCRKCDNISSLNCNITCLWMSGFAECQRCDKIIEDCKPCDPWGDFCDRIDIEYDVENDTITDHTSTETIEVDASEPEYKSSEETFFFRGRSRHDVPSKKSIKKSKTKNEASEESTESEEYYEESYEQEYSVEKEKKSKHKKLSKEKSETIETETETIKETELE